MCFIINFSSSSEEAAAAGQYAFMLITLLIACPPLDIMGVCPGFFLPAVAAEAATQFKEFQDSETDERHRREGRTHNSSLGKKN